LLKRVWLGRERHLGGCFWWELCGAGLSAVEVRVRDCWDFFSRIEYGDESRRKGRVGSTVDDFFVMNAVRGARVEYRDWFGGCLM
jgi:hypothetical protein